MESRPLMRLKTISGFITIWVLFPLLQFHIAIISYPLYFRWEENYEMRRCLNFYIEKNDWSSLHLLVELSPVAKIIIICT